MNKFVIDNDFTIEVVPKETKEPYPPDVVLQIDTIWEGLLKRHSTLFNGQLLSCRSIDGNRLVGEFVDYKELMAQLEEPVLRSILDIRPVGACAAITDGSSILVAKRSENVAIFQNQYEVIPAGTVDDSCYEGGVIDIRRFLLHELQEETGIGESAVESLDLSRVFYDPELQAYEICAVIQVAKKTEITLESEHTEWMWCQSLAEVDGNLVPSTKAFLEDLITD